MKVGRHVFSCRSLLLSTIVLNDRGVLIIGWPNILAADMLHIFTISVIGIMYPGEPI